MHQLLASISFPNFDPVAFRLGPVAIRWYGMAYASGFLIAYCLLLQLAKRGKLSISTDRVGDLIGWLVLGVVAGGRAGWWLFYHKAAGAVDPWYEPFAIWHGGMSFHGGLIGVSIALGLWTRLNHLTIWPLADGLALAAPIGLFLGRIANFINAELVGRVTSVSWGVLFPGDTVARHPSQIYEALLEGPFLLLVLLLAARKLGLGSGRIAALFITIYGILRFLIEFTREPDEQLGFIAFGWLTMGQLLSFTLVLVGLVLLMQVRFQKPDVLKPRLT